MRLTQLFESMIRLPENLTSDVMEFVYAYVIDFMAVKNDDEHSGHVFLSTIDIHPKYPELHKRLKFSHTSNVIMNAKIGLGSYQFKYNISEEDKFINIRIVDTSDHYYGGYDDDTNMLTLNVHTLKMMMADQEPKESFINYTLHEFENTVEHELMHFVQFKAFSNVDPRQVQNHKAKDGSQEEYIKYATSAVELLPTLKSEFNTFRNKIKFLSKSIQVNNNDRMQLMRYFVGDEGARVDRFTEFLDDFHSPVLKGIKDQNPDLWKKAVKVMIQQYRENF